MTGMNAALYAEDRCKHVTKIKTAGGEIKVMCELGKGHDGQHCRQAHKGDRIEQDEHNTGWKITWGEWGSAK